MSKQVRTPDGYKPVPSPEGVEVISGLVAGGEVSIPGTPVFVSFNNTGNGPTNLNLPRASQYTGSTLNLDLQAAAPDGITLVPNGADGLVNPPGAITAAATFLQLVSTGGSWIVVDITALV